MEGVRDFTHPGGVLRGLLFVEKEASAQAMPWAPPRCLAPTLLMSWGVPLHPLAGVENVPWQGNLVGEALLGELPGEDL